MPKYAEYAEFSNSKVGGRIIFQQNKECVDGNDFRAQYMGHIPLFWLHIGLVICEFVICEVWTGRIYRI